MSVAIAILLGRNAPSGLRAKKNLQQRKMGASRRACPAARLAERIAARQEKAGLAQAVCQTNSSVLSRLSFRQNLASV
jgi:hypothetical protein